MASIRLTLYFKKELKTVIDYGLVEFGKTTVKRFLPEYASICGITEEEIKENFKPELGKGSTFTVTLKHRIADESYYEKNIWESLEQEVKSSKAGISFWRRIMI